MANKSSSQTFIVQGSRFAGSAPLFNTKTQYQFLSLGFSGNFLGLYLGVTPINVGCAVVKFYLRQVGSWASTPSQFYYQMGLYSSGNFDSTNTDMMAFERRAVLDLMPYVHTDATYGNVNNTVGARNLIMTPTTAIPRGTHLWIFWGGNVNGGTSVVEPQFDSIEAVTDTLQTGTLITANTNQLASQGRSMAGPQARYILGFAGTGGFGTYYAHPTISVTYYESRAS